jgi:hypothetical protein
MHPIPEHQQHMVANYEEMIFDFRGTEGSVQ